MSQINPYESPRFSGFDPAESRPSSRGLPLASRLNRLGANLLDSLIAFVLCIPGLVILLSAQSSDGRAPDSDNLMLGIALLALPLVALGIYQMYLLSTKGQTLGKMALRVRIVRDDTDENPGFVKAVLLRAIVNGMIGGIPYIGGLYSLIDILFIFGEERRCIHDQIAGTKVVEA